MLTDSYFVLLNSFVDENKLLMCLLESFPSSEVLLLDNFCLEDQMTHEQDRKILPVELFVYFGDYPLAFFLNRFPLFFIQIEALPNFPIKLSYVNLIIGELPFLQVISTIAATQRRGLGISIAILIFELCFLLFLYVVVYL